MGLSVSTKGSKGLSMPINTIIILALALLVLIVISAFFLGGMNTDSVNIEKGFSDGCTKLTTAKNCVVAEIPNIITSYKVNSANKNLHEVCDLKGMDDADCAKACGCRS